MTATGVDSATQTTRTSLADTYVRNDVQANNSSLSMDDFWKLLSAQLRYQDMSNPMSNSEMMGQLTQMARDVTAFTWQPCLLFPLTSLTCFIVLTNGKSEVPH